MSLAFMQHNCIGVYCMNFELGHLIPSSTFLDLILPCFFVYFFNFNEDILSKSASSSVLDEIWMAMDAFSDAELFWNRFYLILYQTF
jgi:hypothetical protein